MIQIFLKGGPVMWPLLLASIAAVTIVMERAFFIIRERVWRDPGAVSEIFQAAEKGDFEQAVAAGDNSRDFVARTLTYALKHRSVSFASALLGSAGTELQRYNRGIAGLDTIVTLAPLLGLFGTVTGMIHAFGLLGAEELGAPMAITGGIAQALIATAFGLLIAMLALLPFNYLNAHLEQARHEIENAAAHLEMLVLREEPKKPAMRA